MANVDNDDQMYAMTLRSLFSTYGEIDIIDLLPLMKTKKGSIKPYREALIKFKTTEEANKALQELNRKVNILENSVGYFHLTSDFKERILLPTTAYNVLKKEIDIATIMVKERFNCQVSVKELVGKGNSTALILKATLQENIQNSLDMLQNIIRPDIIQLRWYLFKRINAKTFSDKIDKIVNENRNCTFVSRDSRTKQVKIYGPKKER